MLFARLPRWGAMFRRLRKHGSTACAPTLHRATQRSRHGRIHRARILQDNRQHGCAGSAKTQSWRPDRMEPRQSERVVALHHFSDDTQPRIRRPHEPQCTEVQDIWLPFAADGGARIAFPNAGLSSHAPPPHAHAIILREIKNARPACVRFTNRPRSSMRNVWPRAGCQIGWP